MKTWNDERNGIRMKRTSAGSEWIHLLGKIIKPVNIAMI